MMIQPDPREESAQHGGVLGLPGYDRRQHVALEHNRMLPSRRGICSHWRTAVDTPSDVGEISFGVFVLDVQERKLTLHDHITRFPNNRENLQPPQTQDNRDIPRFPLKRRS